ncbi:CotO family spore coat protein [Bacillus sp. REN10]|uniref:CotO family spore coat protein n=1 Tax=Bacillus sp. REN10 TaxID=2782541 RepID=UPI00193C850F|nr:CotO family spore coat protein [Bacillus sp. REN10]
MKKKKNEPLMYIQQPSLQYPEVSMQESFHMKNMENKEGVQKKKRVKEERFIEKWDIDEEIDTKVKEEAQFKQPTEEAHEVNTKPSWLGIKPVKPFQEMTMDEKLNHLSRQFIPFPCEFICKEQSHRGILKEWNDREIKVKSFKEEIMIIDREDLQRIRIIGPR